MLVKTKLLLGLTAAAVAAAGAVTAVTAGSTTKTVVKGTAYADAASSPAFTNWFEPSGLLVPKATCGTADDRLVVRTDRLHYRDGASDPVPHEVTIPRPAGTTRLGTDSQVARLKNGRLLYLESGRTTKKFDPPPGWEDYGDWSRTTFELYTSTCGDVWNHATTIDTKDVDGGRCAWPQQVDGGPWPGGFDRAELYVDPYGGDVYIATACRGGTAKDFKAEHLYRRTLLLRLTPDAGTWTLTKAIQLNYGVPVAMTSTSDGSLYMLRCDYDRRPQLLRLADRGERLVSVSDVQNASEATASARCARDWDINQKSIGQKARVPELRLAPAGPRAVRLAYQQLFDGRPQLRYYQASFAPLPAGQPCAEVREQYLAQFVLPDEGNVPPVPECGAVPSFSKARTVRGTDGASIVHFDLIAPDSTGLSSPGAMASSLLYWMEHSPETGLREEKYLTISSSGAWSERRTASTKPWQPRIAPDARDADYEYGSFAFVDGRCRYALVWNESHAEPAGDNLFAHWAIVDDLACSGVVASAAASPTPSKPSPSATPPVTLPVTPPVTPTASSAASVATPSTPAPASPAPSDSPTTQPKFGVAKVTLAVDTCTGSKGTWSCPYSAEFTFSPGKGGSFQWRLLGTLRHDCHPSSGSGSEAFTRPPATELVATGQTKLKVGGLLKFDKAPNPADVYGNPGQASVAHVQVTNGPRSLPDTPFYSNAVCGKP